MNELEAAVLPAYPELGRLKVELVRQGAATALMSGSGSSVFGLFRERETALRAADFFRKDGLRVWAH